MRPLPYGVTDGGASLKHDRLHAAFECVGGRRETDRSGRR